MARVPNDPRTWFAKLADLARRLKRPPDPEPSYVAKVDIDREAERREAEAHRARQQKEAALRAERAKPPPPRLHPVVEAMQQTQSTKTGQAFDKAAQTSKYQTQQTFDARFRSETARAAAFAAMEEANKLRDLNDQTYDEARLQQKEMIKGLNGKAWSNEYGKEINEFLQRAWDAREQEKSTILFDLNAALDEAERLNPPGRGFTKPLHLTGPEPDSMEPFNQAAGSPDWAAIFWRAAKGNVSIEVARAEMETAQAPSPEPAHEPPQEPAMGGQGTPPAGGWLAHFAEIGRNQPNPEHGVDLGR